MNPRPTDPHVAADSHLADTSPVTDPGGTVPRPLGDAPPAGPPAAGRLGPYRVLAELGRGGMGVVYAAEDPALQRQVALKVLAPQLAADPRAKARFLREARAQAKVEHDHIIPIYAVDEAGGVPFIAMPLLRGQTLAAALNQNPRPPLEELVRIGREVAEGLAAAHAVGLIHRDIKPGNIWLEGNKRRVKILDFGLARAETAPDRESASAPVLVSGELTMAGSIMGTPAYMSPEQALSRPLDHRSDLWSLGVVLYRMAVGRLPFTGAGSFDVMAAVVELEPPPVGALVPDVPPALSDLIGRLMAKGPADRPPSAGAVAEELEAIARGLAVLPVQVIPLGAVPGGPNPWADIEETQAESVVSVGGRSREARAPRAAPAGPKWLWPVAGGLGGLVLIALVVLAANGLRPKPKPGPEIAEEPRPSPAQGSAPVAPTLRTVSPDRRAAEYALSIGGGVQVTVDGKTFGVALSDLPKGEFTVAVLDFRMNPRLTDEGLATVRGCRELTQIGMSSTRATDAGVKHLRDCTKLQHVWFEIAGLTDAGLDALADWRDLRQLYLNGSAVTGTGLAALQNCKSLEGLHLNGTPVADANLVHVKPLERLVTLVISSPHLSDAGMAHLVGCRNLGSLSVRETRLTDAGLEPLAAIPTLGHLDVRGTKVTAGGLEKFAKALPGCKVLWDGGTVEPQATPDRKAADWLRALNRGVTVRLNGVERPVPPTDPLPGAPWVLAHVQAQACPQLTDQTLELFRDCKTATIIDIHHNPQITDAGMRHFEGFKDVVHLNLDLSKVTDEGLTAFRDCKKLGYLNLRNARITGACLAQIAGYPVLKTLYLDGTVVGDDGLDALKGHGNLSTLYLSNTRVTDAGLEHLATIPNLGWVTLQKTKVTEEGVNKLAAALPKCRIEWDGVTIEPKKP